MDRGNAWGLILAVGLVAVFAASAAAHPFQHGWQRTPRNRRPRRTVEPGTKPEIPADQLVIVKVNVVGAETKKALPHRVSIVDAKGKYYPPEGHVKLAKIRGNNSNISSEPDTHTRGTDWAMIAQGTFTVHLRAGDGYKVRISHGLEYEMGKFTFDLAGKAGKTVTKTLTLTQGIDMRKAGWMSADSHVHNLTPVGAARQMPIEDIDYVNLMFIGPGHGLLRRGFVTGKPHPASTKDRIVYVSQEVRDANQGHMTLLGMSKPVTPIRVYTGRELNNRMKVLPNEPLNWEVRDYMRAQKGLAFHAHYLFWPGHGSAVGGALGKLDGVEWLQTDIVKRGSRTRQNIEVPGHKRTGAGPMWYYMLNCGVKLPLLGGTDKMSAARVLGCTSRTYAKVPSWTHKGFMAALRAGATFVTNGPLLNLTANGKPIGSQLKFTGAGPFDVQVETGVFSQRRISYFEIVQDGEVVHRVAVKPDQKTVKVSHKLTFSRSGWLAVRAGHPRREPDNWDKVPTAAHSSPIYVTVNGRLPAVKASAEYMAARVGAAIAWGDSVAVWSSPAYKARALASFRKAHEFYEAALTRAAEDAPAK